MNRRITALTYQQRNRNRVNIFLDGEFAFGVAQILAAWLRVGMELSEEKIFELQSADELETAYQRALNLLSYRPRTAAEIRRKLERWGAQEHVIVNTLERLTRNGLVNDAAFSQRWIENRIETRPRSRRALSYELKQHGVEPELIEKAIFQIDDNEQAYLAAKKQARKLKQLEWKEFRQKMLRHLAQRGFDYETSSAATRKFWDEVMATKHCPDEGIEI